MERKKRFNPVLPRRLALLFEPIVRSAIVLYLYVLYLLVKLYLARFRLLDLCKRSAFVTMFVKNPKGVLPVCSVCMAQYTFMTCAMLLFISNYLALGNTLPRSVVKNTDLSGKVAVVTGGYSGIGYETVLQLLKWKCRVVVLGRDKTRATNAIQRMKSTQSFNEKNVSFIEMDLDDLMSVKRAANMFLNQFNRLDFLINNAGIWSSKLKTTSNKLESQFSSNYLGHFYLTKLLVDLVKKSEGRIINVASIALFKYDPYKDGIFQTKSTTSLKEERYNTYYGRSKLFNVWFTHSLQRRVNVENKRVLVMSLSPGVINTKLLWTLKRPSFYLVPKYLNLLILKRPVDGAATTLHLCATPADQLISGAHYNERRLAFVSKHTHNYELEEKLHSLGEELIAKLSK